MHRCQNVFDTDAPNGILETARVAPADASKPHVISVKSRFDMSRNDDARSGRRAAGSRRLFDYISRGILDVAVARSFCC